MEDPPEITHKKWRHKELGYEVEVLEVRNYSDPPFYRTVIVDRTLHTKKPRTWSASLFVKVFDPIGAPRKKSKTLWDHL